MILLPPDEVADPSASTWPFEDVTIAWEELARAPNSGSLKPTSPADALTIVDACCAM
jgi:hypothetical protein